MNSPFLLFTIPKKSTLLVKGLIFLATAMLCFADRELGIESCSSRQVLDFFAGTTCKEMLEGFGFNPPRPYKW